MSVVEPTYHYKRTRLVRPLVVATVSGVAATCSLLYIFTFPGAFVGGALAFMVFATLAGHSAGTAIAIAVTRTVTAVHNSWLSVLLWLATALVALPIYNALSAPSTGNNYTFGLLPLVGFASFLVPLLTGLVSFIVLARRKRNRIRSDYSPKDDAQR